MALTGLLLLLQEGKVKNTPWGSSYRAPQAVLHGAPCMPLPPIV